MTEAKLKHEKLEAETGGAAQKATAAHQEAQRQLASLQQAGAEINQAKEGTAATLEATRAHPNP